MAEISQGDYRIYRGSDCLYLQHLSYSKVLTIEKFSCSLYESEAEVLNKVTLYDIVKPHAILGTLKIGSIDFLVYVKVGQSVGLIDEAEIFYAPHCGYRGSKPGKEPEGGLKFVPATKRVEITLEGYGE